MATTVSLTAVQQVICRALAAGIHDRGRIERAATLIALGAVSQLDAETFSVRSQSDPSLVYRVAPSGCTCPDAGRHPAQRCKHDIAVRVLLSAEREQQAQAEQTARADSGADRLALAFASARRAA